MTALCAALVLTHMVNSFSIVAGSTVQVLILKAKHYNALDANALQIAHATYELRQFWRQKRKLEAHKGRYKKNTHYTTSIRSSRCCPQVNYVSFCTAEVRIHSSTTVAIILRTLVDPQLAASSCCHSSLLLLLLLHQHTQSGAACRQTAVEAGSTGSTCCKSRVFATQQQS